MMRLRKVIRNGIINQMKDVKPWGSVSKLESTIAELKEKFQVSDEQISCPDSFIELLSFTSTIS